MDERVKRLIKAAKDFLEKSSDFESESAREIEAAVEAEEELRSALDAMEAN